MSKKITLIQDSEDKNKWHWAVLMWHDGAWVTKGCDLEGSYERAVEEAKKAYDGLVD